MKPALIYGVAALLLPLGCSGSDNGQSTSDIGGASATVGGNSSATGGASAGPGGSGGAQSTGDLSATGGALVTGGAPAIGGSAATGGSAVNGGSAATGGSKTTGGSVASGGVSAATGGSVTTGGSVAAGGSAATGGSKSTGGTSAAAGSKATGGMATGGAPATGGSKATGGAATGGTPATGGSKATGGALGTGGAGVGGSTGIFKPPYIIGADISWTLEDEAAGAKYVEGGVTKALERIFANNGFNFIRLRTFVNPKATGGYSAQGFCDTAHTIAMAKRVKACKMGVFLDFHMSDTWASIGVQNVPAAWAGMSAAQMQTAAHDYVKSTLDQMVAAGVKPDMVQVGNEINSHMSGVSISNWANLAGLVNAGIRAVRETDPNIIVWAQHGRPRPDGNFTPWVDQFLAGNPTVNVDGICGSTYGTTNNGADWQDQFGYVINTYNKPVMSCEYTDQRRALINGIMHGFANQMGRGTFLWEPTRYPGQNDGTLFDYANNTYTANAAMAQYPTLAKSYGLPVPSTPAATLDATATCK